MKRNINPKGKYKASYATGLAEIRKERLKRPRKMYPQMEEQIRKAMTENQWLPQQIKGRAAKQGEPMVSPERIYQFIRKDKLDGWALCKHTRHCLKHRKRPVGEQKPVIKGKVSIDERPAIINDRTRFGDWEIDTIVREGNKGAVVTDVERQTGFLIMRKLPQEKVAKGLVQTVVELL